MIEVLHLPQHTTSLLLLSGQFLFEHNPCKNCSKYTFKISSKETDASGIYISPSINKTGHATPPKAVAPSSYCHSLVVRFGLRANHDFGANVILIIPTTTQIENTCQQHGRHIAYILLHRTYWLQVE